ncbi:hypothetical protein QR680_001824 [Steinernema hermaphroditum]|uniref:Uncharacterized protein n=1 Tax=Steinernema hermaphroditum TaxID=289476 RepID=A0AA39H014_9BILA|nr:hypothetical protein QR680_001824 [Steinernema hermaphroditum]
MLRIGVEYLDYKHQTSEMFLRRFWNEWNLVHEESTKGTLPGSRKVTVQSPSFTSDYTATASDELRFHGKHSPSLINTGHLVRVYK